MIETAGTWARNTLDAGGRGAGMVPGVGPGLRGALHWLATIVSAGTDLVSTVVKAVVELVAAVVTGLLRLAGGLVVGTMGAVGPDRHRSDGSEPRPDRRTFAQGLGEVGASLAGPLLLCLSKLLALVQAVLLSQRGERPLTADERALLRRIYRGSVALYNVRVVDGFAGLFSFNKRPFTLGNTIYMKRREPERYAATLVHECAHVWQNQHVGSRYAVQAVWAQMTEDDAYRWSDELARGNRRWLDFNREAQAQLLMHVWQRGRRGAEVGEGVAYTDDPVGDDVTFAWDGVDHTALVREAIAAVRAARSRRYSLRL
ncbi:MAG TPA: hypothetical protein VGO78_20910 [Acidimicrobiales bacterium]|nr:hypothetical protein [Acidimicrobiales bacterium]